MMQVAPPPDLPFLRRAIDLAMRGRGGVEPNPMVGCVIVKNDRVIGEGFHQQFGGPHAEPTALSACTEDPRGATAYVTLEPCSHQNKKTPPCAPRLIEAGIARVVVGCLDPNPDVDGKGVAMLQSAGVVVDRATAEIEASAKQLIAPFIARTKFQRPYVTLKWAQSADGLVAGRLSGGPVWITNATSNRVVHELRARCDAIAVGTNTVLNDDPLLTARGVEARRPLLRVVLSNSLKIAPTSRLVMTAREHPVVVYSCESSVAEYANTVHALRDAGVEVVSLPKTVASSVTREGRFSFADVLRDLHARNITHLLIEPGPTLSRYLLDRGQADRVWVFRSPRKTEDLAGPTAPHIEYPSTGSINLDGDELTEYLNPRSDVFFAAEPSADMVLATKQTGQARN